LLHSNIFIALCSVAFYLTGTIVFHGRIGYQGIITGFLFFSTLLIYNVSQQKLGVVTPKRAFPNPKGKSAIVLVIITLIISIYLLFIPTNAILYLFHLGLISILYNAPFFRNTKSLPLRSIPLIKVFIIAYVWASIGSILPVIILEKSLTATAGWLFLSQCLFILGITLPFDIRDYFKDKSQELLTVPGLIGVKRTKILATIFLLIHAGIQYTFLNHSWLLFWNVIPIGLVWWANEGRSRFYYLFFVDGMIILFFLVFYIDNFIP